MEEHNSGGPETRAWTRRASRTKEDEGVCDLRSRVGGDKLEKKIVVQRAKKLNRTGRERWLRRLWFQIATSAAMEEMTPQVERNGYDGSEPDLRTIQRGSRRWMAEVRDVVDLIVRRLWSMIVAPSTKERRRRRSGVGEAEAAA
ncbi:hypothetical protein U1Q18_005006 [Sarracenia purpurea var. burkii]